MAMENRTYKMIELVGASNESIEDALQSAVSRAGETMRHIDWFEVKEIRGAIVEGKISAYQVKFTLGFRLEK